MNDRELLELAAKAAGKHLTWYDVGPEKPWDLSEGTYWNPLTDDGDALRLRNALHMTVMSNEMMSWVATGMHQIVRAEERHDGTNVDAATRRAIVRAAAAIGEEME